MQKATKDFRNFLLMAATTSFLFFYSRERIRTSISFSQTFFPLSPCARLTDTPNIQEAAMNHGILAARTRYNRKHRTIKNCASCSRINHESIQPSSGLTAATVVTDRAQFAVSGTVATTIPSWCTHLTEKNIYIYIYKFVCVYIIIILDILLYSGTCVC